MGLLYRKRNQFEEMTNLPKSLIEQLQEEFTFSVKRTYQTTINRRNT